MQIASDKFRWAEHKKYWVNLDNQRSSQWYRVKRGRPSGSSACACIGRSRFKTREEQAEILKEMKIPKDSPKEENENIRRGIEFEDTARKILEQQLNVRIEEVGACIPKFDLRICASSDGLIYDKDTGKELNLCVEIKCPKKMYNPILEYTELPVFVKKLRKKRGDYSHIWYSHYVQMQFTCACLHKQGCIYFVYVPDTEEYFRQYIPFNKKEWKEDIYPEIVKFIDEFDLNPEIYPN